MKRLIVILSTLVVAAAGAVAGAAPAHAMDVTAGYSGGRTAVAVYHPGGGWSGSPNAREPRPALSLSKLYLGYWVLHHAAPEDKARVEQMIRTSDDAIASLLDAHHPHAIDQVARDFGLTSTRRGGHWGLSSTSAYDVAKFLNDIRTDPVAWPLLNGMRTAAPVAADGFAQNYGTSHLPGAQGTKFGWSDDRVSLTASASFGPDWTAAALTHGDVAANTADTLGAISPGLTGGPGAATSSAGPVELPLISLRDALRPYFPPAQLEQIPATIMVPAGPPVVR
ncbi:hypothetical protein [Corynebacterium sp. LK2510]|uniref:hypothetical protein n=1 Tax=Corynebacterium sp. LK2510 TaxID=3110472 RepID=UPI0034CF2C4E